MYQVGPDWGDMVHTKMLREAEKVGWPTSYKTDLTQHDRARLIDPDAPERFVWVLREMGTEILDVRMSRNSIAGFRDHYAVDGKDHRYYICSNGELRNVSFEAAFLFLEVNNHPLGVEGHNRY